MHFLDRCCTRPVEATVAASTCGPPAPEQGLVERLDEPERSPCSSVSTSARRSASRTIEPALSRAGRQRARSLLRSSRSSTAARIEAAQTPSPAPSSAVSASRTWPERNGSSAKSESSQRSSASPSSRSSSASGSRSRRSAATPARIASSRIASPSGLRRGDREQRRDPQRPEVEPLEDDGAGGDRAGGREPKRADGVGQLAGGVGRLALARVELAGQLEDAQPVDVAPELRAASARAPRARATESSPGTTARTRMPPPSSTGRAGREADERRDRGVGACACRRATARSRRRRPRTRRRSSRSRRSARRLRSSVGSRIVRKSASSSLVAEPRVGVREDRRGGLAAQVVDRVARVRAAGAASAPAPRRSCGRAAGTRRATGRRGSGAPRRRTAARRRARPRTPRGRTRAGTGRGAVPGAPRLHLRGRSPVSYPSSAPGRRRGSPG